MRLVILSAIVFFPLMASAQFPFNIGGPSLDQGFAVAVMPDFVANPFVVVAGEFRQTADFDPGPGEHFLTANGTRDAFVASYTLYGSLRWAFNVGGPGVDGANGVAIDEDGNVYVVGTFRQTADFDPGDDEYLITSNGETDAFIASYTSEGQFRWAFNLGGTHFDQGHAVTVTDFGAVCATGSFRETVDFDPGEGETTFTSAGSYNIWVACYTLDGGDLVWAYGTGGPGNFDRGWSITAYDSAVYVTGDFTGTTQFDPAGDVEPLTALGLNDIFVVSYGQDGAFRWAHRAGGSSNEIGDRGNAIAVAVVWAAPYVYVTGDFVGTADLPTGQAFTSAGGRDAFVAIFETNGEPFSAFPISSPGDNRGTGVTAVGKHPLVQVAVVTGYFEGTVDLAPSGGKTVTSPGGRSFFLASYEYDWPYEGRAVGGPLNDQSYGIAGHFDQVYVTGSFRDSVDFKPGVLTTNGPLDAFVAHYQLLVPPTPSVEPGAVGTNAPRVRLAGPNPAQGSSRVAIRPLVTERVTVEVFDVLGRLVSTALDDTLSGDEEVVVTIGAMSPGLYMIRARGATGASSLRITIIGR